MKHTQGKWEVDGQNIRNKKGLIAIAYDQNDYLHQTKIALANARLIASAPELLEVCKEILPYLRLNRVNNSPLYEKVKQVISKAEEKAR